MTRSVPFFNYPALFAEHPTGEPASWHHVAEVGPTWWRWSREWVGLKWPQWSGNSRRTAVETLALFAPLMVKEDAPEPPTGLSEWLRNEGYRPDGADTVP